MSREAKCVMHTRLSRISVAALFALCSTTALHGQGCADQASRINFGMGRSAVSVDELQTPAKAWQHLELARRAFSRNDGDGVLAESRRALAIQPRFAQAYLLQALWAVHNARYEEAKAAASQAQAIRPQLPWAGVILAGALLELHQEAKASAVLDAIHTSEAGGWQVSYERARVALSMGQLSDALHWSELAVNTAPAGCTQTRLVRANVLTLAGRRVEAVAEMQSYLREDRQGSPRRDQVVQALGRSDEGAGARLEKRSDPATPLAQPELGEKPAGSGGFSLF